MTVRRMLLLEGFGRGAALSPLVIRLFLGGFLVYMSHDNVLSAARMAEFAKFLTHHGFPAPAVSAQVSVYAQFTCGLLVLAGALTRLASLVMVVNFVVAIAMVHWHLPFKTWLEPTAMLACALALLLGGPGPISVDRLLSRER